MIITRILYLRICQSKNKLLYLRLKSSLQSAPLNSLSDNSVYTLRRKSIATDRTDKDMEGEPPRLGKRCVGQVNGSFV